MIASYVSLQYVFMLFRIMNVVSQFYIEKREAGAINNHVYVLAALVLEKPKDGCPSFEIPLFTMGTKYKRKHSTKHDCWDICDGHAEAMCYQLASIYLLDEIHKEQDSSFDSIFELKSNMQHH